MFLRSDSPTLFFSAVFPMTRTHSGVEGEENVETERTGAQVN